MVNSLGFTSVNTLKTLDASRDLPGKAPVGLLTCFRRWVTQSDLFKTFPFLHRGFRHFMLWLLSKPILQLSQARYDNDLQKLRLALGAVLGVLAARLARTGNPTEAFHRNRTDLGGPAGNQERRGATGG
jgi:hypothetical protein